MGGGVACAAADLPPAFVRSQLGPLVRPPAPPHSRRRAPWSRASGSSGRTAASQPAPAAAPRCRPEAAATAGPRGVGAVERCVCVPAGKKKQPEGNACAHAPGAASSSCVCVRPRAGGRMGGRAGAHLCPCEEHCQLCLRLHEGAEEGLLARVKLLQRQHRYAHGKGGGPAAAAAATQVRQCGGGGWRKGGGGRAWEAGGMCPAGNDVRLGPGRGKWGAQRSSGRTRHSCVHTQVFGCVPPVWVPPLPAPPGPCTSPCMPVQASTHGGSAHTPSPQASKLACMWSHVFGKAIHTSGLHLKTLQPAGTSCPLPPPVHLCQHVVAGGLAAEALENVVGDLQQQRKRTKTGGERMGRGGAGERSCCSWCTHGGDQQQRRVCRMLHSCVRIHWHLLALDMAAPPTPPHPNPGRCSYTSPPQPSLPQP